MSDYLKQHKLIHSYNLSMLLFFSRKIKKLRVNAVETEKNVCDKCDYKITMSDNMKQHI